MEAALAFVPILPTATAFQFSANFVARRAPSSTHRYFSAIESSSSTAAHDSDIIPTKCDIISPNKTNFDSFDYKSQWYPVIWAADVPLNEPVRVTLFDVHYVVWKTTLASEEDSGAADKNVKEVFHALIDSCPHKKVALSEGRITSGSCSSSSDTHLLQCSYHGWTFDGYDGKCVEIPQTLIAQRERGRGGKDNADDAVNKKSRQQKRQDATSVAVTQAQGMVWLQPSKSPLEALNIEGPPRIPELDMDGYKATVAVRDFPIDWTVLMENIMDPDHGYFAHSSSGSMALAFDWYASDGTDNMIHIQEEFSDNGWKISSSVNAVDKLIKYNKEVRMPMSGLSNTNGKTRGFLVNKNKPRKKDDPPKLATTTFIAPSVITLGRRDNLTAASTFLTGFWICPVGTGKSRFMSAAISKSPIAIPRWLVHMNLNNFLDQDTYLLVGQNRAVLKSEAEAYLKHDADTNNQEVAVNNNARKSTYVYRSPSERMGVRIGQFFDATLSRVPHRKEALVSWYNNRRLFEEWPLREVVLDRYKQHTAICPDSMDVVANCDKIIQISKFVGGAVLFMKIMYDKISYRPVLQAAQESLVIPTSIGVVKLGRFAAKTMAMKLVQMLMTNTWICTIVGLASGLVLAASAIRKEFFFKFDDALHRKDIKFIANNWVDV